MENPFPPFDPDGDDKTEPTGLDAPVRLRDIPLRTLFPNILTLLAICSGLTSIRFAVDGRIELAVAAIIFAGFLDGIDGRVARFLKSTSRFGAEMDSLADFVNFGVAPALLLYFVNFPGGRRGSVLYRVLSSSFIWFSLSPFWSTSTILTSRYSIRAQCCGR